MKTHIITISCAFMLGSIGLSAQIKSDRPLADFSGLKASGAFHVTLTQGDANSMNIEGADQSNIDGLKSEIKDGILELSASGKKGNEVTVNITVKSLKSIEASDAVDIRSKTLFHGDQVIIKASGASDIHFESETKEMTTDLSGASDVVLSGSTDMLVADVSGAGTLKATKLVAAKAVVTSSGAGDARVNPRQSLNAKVSGAGDVIYLEEPVEKTVDLSGAGSVRMAHSKHAQGKNGSDTTKLSLGHHKVMITEGDDEEEKEGKHPSDKDSFHHWNGIDVGINGLVTSGGSFNMPKTADYMTLEYEKSFSFAINFFEKDIHLYKNYVNLVTGLGFEFNHFALQHNVSLRHDSSYTTANASPVNFRKNNLNESLLTLPLMFEFNTSTNASKSVHLAVGMLGAWKIGAKTRQKYVDPDGKVIRNTTSNDYNLDPFRYSLTVRAGYGRYTVFANYALSELFKADRGPVLYPVTAGIHISI